jgi:hypothetical protein
VEALSHRQFVRQTAAEAIRMYFEPLVLTTRLLRRCWRWLAYQARPFSEANLTRSMDSHVRTGVLEAFESLAHQYRRELLTPFVLTRVVKRHNEARSGGEDWLDRLTDTGRVGNPLEEAWAHRERLLTVELAERYREDSQLGEVYPLTLRPREPFPRQHFVFTYYHHPPLDRTQQALVDCLLLAAEYAKRGDFESANKLVEKLAWSRRIPGGILKVLEQERSTTR